MNAYPSPDSAETLHHHAHLIRTKALLHRTYESFYGEFLAALHSVANRPGEIVELGTGGGFLKEVIPGTLTTDVIAGPGIDRIADATALPFGDASLKALCLLNVLHHLQNPRAFFREAIRTLVPGGVVVMVEPGRTLLSRWIYRHFHAEPFDDLRLRWEPDSGGRLTGSNQAMPWIIFVRDRHRYESEFPLLPLERLTAHTSLCYLASGGLQRWCLAPGAAYPLIKRIDRILESWPSVFPLFYTIVLRRKT